MVIRYECHPDPTPELEDAVLQLWVAVTNAGGAVGFVGPVGAEDVRPAWERHRDAILAGTSHLVVGWDEDGRAAALTFLQLNDHALARHWVGLWRVMVRPSLQGTGEGRRMMAAVEDRARALDGVGALRLTCRGGLGLERFYEACGYKEVGRVPGALRVAADDFRDEIIFWRELR